MQSPRLDLLFGLEAYCDEKVADSSASGEGVAQFILGETNCVGERRYFLVFHI